MKTADERFSFLSERNRKHFYASEKLWENSKQLWNNKTSYKAFDAKARLIP